jgi:hypothetical protein
VPPPAFSCRLQTCCRLHGQGAQTWPFTPGLCLLIWGRSVNLSTHTLQISCMRANAHCSACLPLCLGGGGSAGCACIPARMQLHWGTRAGLDGGGAHRSMCTSMRERLHVTNVQREYVRHIQEVCKPTAHSCWGPPPRKAGGIVALAAAAAAVVGVPPTTCCPCGSLQPAPSIGSRSGLKESCHPGRSAGPAAAPAWQGCLAHVGGLRRPWRAL